MATGGADVSCSVIPGREDLPGVAVALAELTPHFSQLQKWLTVVQLWRHPLRSRALLYFCFPTSITPLRTLTTVILQ